MKLLRHLLTGTSMALGLMVTSAPAADADATASADATVEHLHEALLASMQAGEASVQERADTLRPVIHDTFDFETIARVVLGRTWGELDAGERRRFVEVFGEHSVATYAARFKAFNGERFVTLGSDAGRRNDERLVRTQLERPASGKQPVSLQYLLKEDSSEQWRVVNVVADGVSDLSLKRTEYAAALKEGGISALVERLENKTARLYEGESAE